MSSGQERSEKGLLMAIDVGNTHTVIGLLDGENLIRHWRIATEPVSYTHLTLPTICSV